MGRRDQGEKRPDDSKSLNPRKTQEESKLVVVWDAELEQQRTQEAVGKVIQQLAMVTSL